MGNTGASKIHFVKPPLSKRLKIGFLEKMVFKTNYRLMQVKGMAEHSTILLTFIKLPFVIKILFLSGRFT